MRLLFSYFLSSQGVVVPEENITLPEKPVVSSTLEEFTVDVNVIISRFPLWLFAFVNNSRQFSHISA